MKHLVDLAADGTKVDRARAKRIRYLPYRYDIAGIVTIGSQVRLPRRLRLRPRLPRPKSHASSIGSDRFGCWCRQP